MKYFVHSSTEGHPGYFKVWEIMNNASVNICVQDFV